METFIDGEVSTDVEFTKRDEIIKRIKTLLWSSGLVGATFFVDTFSQVFIGVSLPDIEIPGFATVKTSILLGLVITQVSKYLHNKRAGEFSV